MVQPLDMDGRPLIAQGDQSLLLDAHDTSFEEARAELSAFATLEKSPEHFHTYRLDALSLWNAASAGLDADAIMATMERWTRYPLTPSIGQSIRETMARFGKIILTDGPDEQTLRLQCDDPFVRAEMEG